MKEAIKVAYVNPPKEGKKKGLMKTEDGRYYGAYPEKLSLFKPGETYEIEYSGHVYAVAAFVRNQGRTES